MVTKTQNIITNIMTLSQADPEELSLELLKRYAVIYDVSIENTEDYDKLGDLLVRLGNEQSFLYNALQYLKTRARIERNKGKENKKTAEYMAMRRDSVDLTLEGVKKQYEAISRKLSAHKMKIDEMRMLGETQTTYKEGSIQ